MNARRGLKSWLVTTMSENAAVDRLNALVSKLVAAIRPPPNVSVSEWATQNRVLSPEASAEQGRWRNSRTPYLVEIMDASPTRASIISLSLRPHRSASRSLKTMS